MKKTKIPWADFSWNPWYGCQKTGPGCDNCYAEGWGKRSGLVQWGPNAERQRWRALALVIKAKLEAVEAGITEFEEEFLAHIVLPNGGTVGQFMLPQVATAYETGQMPPLLPAPDE